MVKLLNADIFGERPENYVSNEELKKVKTNALNYIQHGIYFADTLDICTNPADSSTRLSLESDYTFAELDTIATEQSGRDCYRAIVFLKDFEKLYISYHSYGDIVSAELFNEFIKSIENAAGQIDKLNLSSIKIFKAFEQHILNDKAHNAAEDAVAGKIAVRTEDGTLRGKEAKKSDDLVNLESQTKALQNLKTEINNRTQKKNNEIFDLIEKNNKKIALELQALLLKNFLPQDAEFDKATPEQKDAAKKLMDKKASELNPFFNAVRNVRGSLTVPEPEKDSEAVNLKFLNEKKAQLENELSTAKTKIKNLEAELKNLSADEFNFDDKPLKINKTFNGKPVYRKGFNFQIPAGGKKNIDIDKLNIKNIINIHGLVFKSDETRPLNLTGVEVYTTKRGLIIKPPANYPECKVYVFLEFIKPTF